MAKLEFNQSIIENRVISAIETATNRNLREALSSMNVATPNGFSNDTARINANINGMITKLTGLREWLVMSCRRFKETEDNLLQTASTLPRTIILLRSNMIKQIIQLTE